MPDVRHSSCVLLDLKLPRYRALKIQGSSSRGLSEHSSGGRVHSTVHMVMITPVGYEAEFRGSL
jgi:hypothetical protein